LLANLAQRPDQPFSIQLLKCVSSAFRLLIGSLLYIKADADSRCQVRVIRFLFACDIHAERDTRYLYKVVLFIDFELLR
jgi:hypothetical protein